MYKTCLRTISL